MFSFPTLCATANSRTFRRRAPTALAVLGVALLLPLRASAAASGHLTTSPPLHDAAVVAALFALLFGVALAGRRSLRRQMDANTNCLARSVEEKVRLSEALHTSHDRYRLLVDSVQEYAIFLLTAQGEVATWNAGAERVKGYTAEEAFGLPLSQFYLPEDVEAGVPGQALGRSAAAGRFESEGWRVRRDGSRFWATVVLTALRDDAGGLCGFSCITRDVTQRRRVEAQLAFQARVLSQVNEPIVGVDANGQITYWNPGAERLYGVLAADAVGRPLAEIYTLRWIRPGDEQRAKATFAATGSWVGEQIHRRRSGEEIYVESFISVLTDERGEPIGSLAAARDVTERRRVREALHARAHQQAAIAELSQHALAESNLDALMDEAVRAVVRTLEVDCSNILELQPYGQSLLLRSGTGWTPGLVGRAIAGGGCASQAGYTLTVDEPVIVSDLARDTRFSDRTFLTDEGIVSGISVIIRSAERPYGVLSAHTRTRRTFTTDDVHFLESVANVLGVTLQRSRAESALRESEANYRLLNEEIMRALSLLSATLEATTDGMLTVDSQSQITSFNRRFVEMWSVPDDLIVRHDAAAVLQFAAGGLKTADALLSQAAFVTTNQEAELNGLLELKDGRVFEIASRPQRLGPTCVGRVWSFRDVTERLRLEAQVQHTQKLESLGVLAGGIAHDFNNLLLGVLGHAGLARMELPADSPIQPRLDQIELTAQRAAELTNQMLAYSGKGRFVVEAIDLSSLVQEMTHLLHSVISKRAELRFDFAAALPAVHADVSQIRQVVMNLITNASDALGDANGSITIRTGLVHADAHYLADTYVHARLPDGPYAFVEVSDTGCGMDGSTRGRIFDPFFTTKFTGRGLGLAAVLGIVRGHHGAIKLSSEPGLGTTFRVLLPPAAHAVPAVDKPAPVRDTWHSGGLVLVVDDEEGVRTVAQGVLERCGFHVLEARDGREGVDVFRAHATDIRAVLLDMTMPRMSGVEALREIRRIRRDVPVILSSGYSEEDAAGHFRFGEDEMAGFIQKPYAAIGLVDKIRQALDVSVAGMPV